MLNQGMALYGEDQSLQRLNSDIPQAPAAVVEKVEGEDAEDAEVDKEHGTFESADKGLSQMSAENRMESIPEEVSKANLHSSHSKIGALG